MQELYIISGVQFLTLTFTTKETLPPVHLVFKTEVSTEELRPFHSLLPAGEHPLACHWNAQKKTLSIKWAGGFFKRHACKISALGDQYVLHFYLNPWQKPIEIGVLDLGWPQVLLEKTFPQLTILKTVRWDSSHPHRMALDHNKDVSKGLATVTDLKGKFCAYPFQRVEIMHGWGDRNDGDISYGNVHVCCMSLVAKPIGNYLQQSMEEVWNSETAQEIRRSILDGSYKYCNRKLCPKIQGGILSDYSRLTKEEKAIVDAGQVVMPPMPQRLLLCFDRSCNLSCPSCRTHKIVHGQGKEFDKSMYLSEKLIEDLFAKPHNNPINLMITGSGDPFASKVYRRLIESIDGKDFPNLTLDLFTNGVLLTPEQWQKLERVHSNIGLISFSIDAATAETYKKVRGGDWQQLMNNMSFVGDLLKTGKIKNFETNFVVQKSNFQEMSAFVRLCALKNVRHINFSPLVNWNTWSKKDFDEQCVWTEDHPLLPQLLQELRSPEMSHGSVRLGALASYRRIALDHSSVQL